MTALNVINLNTSRESIRVDSILNKADDLKKSYGRINHVLRLGELLAPVSEASFFAEPKKIIKDQLTLFTVPGFVGSTLRFSATISKLHSSRLNKTEKLQRTVLPALRYAQSCTTLLQYICALKLVDLKKISTPLSAINAIARLILSGSGFYRQLQRLDHSFSQPRNEGFLFFKNLLDLYSALLCFVTFFFSLAASPYWMLAASSLLLISTMVDNLLKFVLD
jgi:hypothetical protein